MNNLVENYLRKVNKLTSKFARSAYSFLEKDNRLIGLTGARGIGKTTLLLQYAQKQRNFETEVL